MIKKVEFMYKNVKHYDNVNQILEDCTKRLPDKIAFSYRENKEIINISYKQLRCDLLCLLGAIDEHIPKSSHIACIGKNSYEWLLVYLSTLCTKNVFVPVDKDLPIDDLARVISHSDSEYVFCSKKHEKIFAENRDKFGGVKKFISFSDDTKNEDFSSFNDFRKSGNNNPTSFIREKSIDDLKVLMYTSGTTGLAKGVMLSEKNIISCVYHSQRIDGLYDSYISVLPYHHAYEAVCGILVGVSNCTTIFINDNLRRFVTDLSEFKPEYLLLVPAFTEMFYNKIQKNIKDKGMETSFNLLIKLSNALLKLHIDVRKKLFKSIHDVFGGNVKKIVTGGAPIRPEVGDFFTSIGICIANGYGITECSPIISVNCEEINNLRSVGFLLPCLELKFENMINERDGEICVKGDTVMMGYYKNPEQTREVLKDGWFYTGDYGYKNEIGHLFITGRKKNLIVLKNGKNVYPEEIENYILGIDEVLEVIVSSVKNESGEEESLQAEVYLDPAKSISKEELKKKIYDVLSCLPLYKQIRKIVIRDSEFPKTTSKKIKRQ